MGNLLQLHGLSPQQAVTKALLISELVADRVGRYYPFSVTFKTVSTSGRDLQTEIC